MSLYKREGSTIWWYSITINGKRYRGSTKRSNKKEAQAVLDAERQRILNRVQLGAKEEVTIREAVDIWFKVYASKLRDAPQIKRNIKVLFEGPDADHGRAFRKYTLDGSIPAAAITDADIEDLVNARIEEGLSAASIWNELSILRRTVNKLGKKYAMPEITWPSVREDRRLQRNAKERWLTDEELMALAAELDPAKHPAHKDKVQDAQDLFYILLHTGGRPGEIMALTKAMCNLKAGRIMFDRKKVRNWAGLGMSSRVRAIVERRMKTPGPWLFPDYRNPMNHRRVCRSIGNAMKRAGLNEDWKVKSLGGSATMYTLRDTFASRALQSGSHSIEEVSAMLGHSTVRQTQKYARHDPNRLGANLGETLDRLEFKTVTPSGQLDMGL